MFLVCICTLLLFTFMTFSSACGSPVNDNIFLSFLSSLSFSRSRGKSYRESTQKKKQKKKCMKIYSRNSYRGKSYRAINAKKKKKKCMKIYSRNQIKYLTGYLKSKSNKNTNITKAQLICNFFLSWMWR